MSTRRHVIGAISLVLLAVAAVCCVWPPAEGYQQLEGFCSRLGAIMAVWWLAYNDLRRLPVWLLSGLPVVVIVLAKWPRYIFFVIPVLLVLAVLKPRFGAKKRQG